MFEFRRAIRQWVGAAAVVVAVCPALARQEIAATWRNEAIAIDGSADDWQGALTFVDGPNVLVGARNDGESLYLCFYSNDAELGRSASLRGLLLELDGKGQDPLRIQFPTGIPPAGDQPGQPRHERARSADKEQEAFPPLSASLVLLEPGAKHGRSVPLDEALGIELRVSHPSEGSFVYEARIPLHRSEAHPYAAGSEPGGTLLLRLDSVEVDRGEMPAPGEMGGHRGKGGMGPGGTGGGPKGGPGGMRGGGGHGGMAGPPPGAPGAFTMPRLLHLKAKILLASLPS